MLLYLWSLQVAVDDCGQFMNFWISWVGSMSLAVSIFAVNVLTLLLLKRGNMVRNIL